jgi:hypothetical protein
MRMATPRRRSTPTGGRLAARAAVVAAAVLVNSCSVVGPPAGPTATEHRAARARIAALLPPKLVDREGWAEDVYAALTSLELPASDPNACAVIAVTEQESSFAADPAVPNLGRIALREIDARAGRLHLPKLVVRAALDRESPTGERYRDRIERARTERELSEIYETFIGDVPLGRRLLADYNPVRTGGPMQVGIGFAEDHAKRRRYPYGEAASIRTEVFTRRGGLYFGAAHLLDYPADYREMRYRFADYNAGHYASRNAAFQHALVVATKRKLALDGDLLIDGGAASDASETELVARRLAPQLGLDDAQVRRDLARGAGPDFAETALYRGVFRIADAVATPLPRARLPDIRLQGPKIQRRLTTAWFANRVNDRYDRCLSRAPGGARRS